MMRKLVVFAAASLMLAALSTSAVSTRAQEDEPKDWYLISSSTCLALTAPSPACPNAGQNKVLALDLEAQGFLFAMDSDEDGEVERTDLTGFDDFTGGHLHQEDGSLAVIVFVDDDNPVWFDTTKGKFRVEPGVEVDDYICNGDPAIDVSLAADEDCDHDGAAGDGILVAQLISTDEDTGPGTITVYDGISGEEIAVIPFTVVGEADDVSVGGLETTIGAGLDPDECTLPGSASGFLDAIGHPQKTVIIARAPDDEGTNIAGAWVRFTLSDDSKMKVAAPETPTLNLGSFGYGAPNVLCGLEGSGEVTLTVELIVGATGLSLDPKHDAEDFETTFTLIGKPENVTVTAAPASVACDGVNSATVSALVTDGNGNNVADGTGVGYSVQVLGIANPLKAKTSAGTAKSTITPFAVEQTGVPVVVSVGDKMIDEFVLATEDGVDNDGNGEIDEEGETDPDEGLTVPTGREIPNPDYIESSILVKCGAAPAAQPTAPGGTTAPGGAPGGVISGPDTGSGGSLGNVDGRGALPLWPAMALLAGAVALIGARFALRRTP